MHDFIDLMFKTLKDVIYTERTKLAEIEKWYKDKRRKPLVCLGN